MTISELKTMLARIEAEHGNLTVMSISLAGEYGEYTEPQELSSERVHLGWINSEGNQITKNPLNPLTDKTVLVID